MGAPYYQDDLVTLYHGEASEVLAGMEDGSVKAVLTDPPYTERTHSKALNKSGKTRAGKDVIVKGVTAFASITDEGLEAVLSECGRVSAGWVVATLDYHHAFRFDESPPAGLRSLRVGVWVKTNPTPQLSGDRPAQGWEAISYLHKDTVRPKWNGSGGHGNYVHRIADPTGHPTTKPLPILKDWVARFTDHGDTVLDPFAGSGTTLRAAADLGRRSIGVELDEQYCELIAKRLSQQAFDFEDIA